MTNRIRPTPFLAALALLSFLASPLWAETVQVPCTADVWISAYPSERTHSMGKTPKMKIKGYSEWVLMRFDLSKVKGKKVKSARLFLHGARPWMDLNKKAVYKKTGKVSFEGGIESQRYKVNSLRVIGLSTVSQTWVEGQQATDYKEDPEGKGATFLTPSTGSGRYWAWGKDSNLSDVILTNGETLASHPELRKEKKGDGRWFSVPVSLDIMRGMVSGDSDGMAVLDASGQTMENNFIFSREKKGSEPYLVVELGEADTKAAEIEGGLKLQPAAKSATLVTGALEAVFKCPKDTFCLFITVDGKPYPRWKTPHPKGDGEQRVVIDGLAPGKEVEVTLAIDDGQGNRSKVVKTKAKASPATPEPKSLPEVSLKRKSGAPATRGGKLKVYAVPDVIAVDPQSGSIFHSKLKDYKKANPVWSGAENTIHLSGCRGEFVAYQLVLEGQAQNIKVAASDLKNGDKKIAASSAEFFREWYIKTTGSKSKKPKPGRTPTVVDGWVPEVCLPMNEVENLSVPDAKNGVPDQKNQSLWVDLYVPKDAAPGTYRGHLTVSAEGVEAFKLPVVLTVHSFVLPDKLSFVPMLNLYLRQGDELFDAYRLAHKHRCDLHRVGLGSCLVPYGDYFEPKTTGKGKNLKVVDWSDYDRKFGPLLDGSAFKGLPRDGVPLATFRLPHNQDWPSAHDEGYTYREPYFRNLRKPKETSPSWMVEIHHVLTGPLVTKEAYTQDYRDGFSKSIADFLRHAKEKGWTRTEFQVMSNAKIYHRTKWVSTAMWRYDEPMHRDDYLATGVQGELFYEGLRLAGDDAKSVDFSYRQDISRPEWQFDCIDGRIDQILVGGFWSPHRQKRARIQEKQIPAEINNYSSYGQVGGDGMTQPALMVASYLAGCNKTLQWLCFVDAKKLEVEGRPLAKPDRLAILIYAKTRDKNTRRMVQDPAWKNPAFASVRLKGLRRGQQDVELCAAYRKKMGLNLEQMTALVGSYAGSGAQNQKAKVAEEAVGVDFSGLDVERMMQIRYQLMKALD